MVAALLGRYLKCSNLPGRKEWRTEKETQGKGKEGKEVKTGDERKGMKRRRERKRVRIGQYIGKEEENM